MDAAEDPTFSKRLPESGLYRNCKDFTGIYIDAPFFLAYYLGKSITYKVLYIQNFKKEEK